MIYKSSGVKFTSQHLRMVRRSVIALNLSGREGKTVRYKPPFFFNIDCVSFCRYLSSFLDYFVYMHYLQIIKEITLRVMVSFKEYQCQKSPRSVDYSFQQYRRRHYPSLGPFWKGNCVKHEIKGCIFIKH